MSGERIAWRNSVPIPSKRRISRRKQRRRNRLLVYCLSYFYTIYENDKNRILIMGKRFFCSSEMHQFFFVKSCSFKISFPTVSQVNHMRFSKGTVRWTTNLKSNQQGFLRLIMQSENRSFHVVVTISHILRRTQLRKSTLITIIDNNYCKYYALINI